jgi:hypothetical protein
MIRARRSSAWSPRPLSLLLTLVGLTGVVALAACASSGTAASSEASARAEAVTITTGLPRDAAAEPPWNGRFVQVYVSGPSPEKMAASDWSVLVNGKKQPLARPPDILPYAPDAATVAFVFVEPFGDSGDYRFRVVYSPADGPKVARSWLYKWAP